MSEKMLKFVDIDQKNPSKRNEIERKNDFDEIYAEFIPVSSSAHLILVSTLYEFKSSSLLIDISLHLGSLMAIIYFLFVFYLKSIVKFQKVTWSMQ